MKSASIPGYFTNHSLHVTAATQLYDSQVDEGTIMERTGHRSVEGIRTCEKTSDKLKELLSNILNCDNKRANVYIASRQWCGTYLSVMWLTSCVMGKTQSLSLVHLCQEYISVAQETA